MVTDEAVLKKVQNMAALGHTPRQIASLLKIPLSDRDSFIDEFAQHNSKLYEYYMAGKNIAYYNTNVELTKAAETGDVFAIAKLDERKREQNIDDLKYELFGI